MKKHRLLSFVSISLAGLTLTSAVLAACQKAPEGNWRDEVTSVLSQVEEERPAVTTSHILSIPLRPGDYPEEGYTNENAGKAHPITNPDKDKIPTVSFGKNNLLIYGDQLYVMMSEDGVYQGLVHSVNLADLISYDPTAVCYLQPVPKATPLCFDPFCQHKTYAFNNGIVCPLNFMNTGAESKRNASPIYCIDYTQSKGESPVFYILAAEPEYKIVGEQVEESIADGYAIYRYDTAVGKREIIKEDLSITTYSMDIAGDYLYCGASEGMIALDKKGNQVGAIESADTKYYILDKIGNTLYIADSVGDIYTANETLGNLQKVFSIDTSQMDENMIKALLRGSLVPYGYLINDGYLYYCSDPKPVSETSSLKSTSIYRLPVNDLNAEPELLVDGKCYSIQLHGVVNGKVYFTPAINQYGKDESKWLIGRCLAYCDLANKEVTVLEEHAFDMPWFSNERTVTPLLTSAFVIGAEQQYNHSKSFLALYHFETGDIMYISMRGMYGVMQ